MNELTYEECVELRQALRFALFHGGMDPVLADKLFELLHRRVYQVNPQAIESGEYV